MASSKGMAPGVLLPTVPSMGSSASMRPTKGTSNSKVVKVPRVSGMSRRTTPKVRAPKVKVAKPKLPKDANALFVPKAKRVKNGAEKGRSFSTKRKPVI